MEQILINEFVCLKFSKQVLFAHQSTFVQRKACINTVICYRTIYYIIIVYKVLIEAVIHHKINPFIGRRFKEQALNLLQLV